MCIYVCTINSICVYIQLNVYINVCVYIIHLEKVWCKNFIISIPIANYINRLNPYLT